MLIPIHFCLIEKIDVIPAITTDVTIKIKFLSNGEIKHTLKNIQENSEFVVNIVSNDIADAMNITSGEYSEDTNEFEVSGLTQIDSQIVRPPRVAESPVNMECKLERIVELGSESDPHGLVIGEVVLLHLDDDVVSAIDF